MQFVCMIIKKPRWVHDIVVGLGWEEWQGRGMNS